MRNYIALTASFILSATMSYFLTPVMRRIALKNRILSQPGRRRIHKRPKPYLGGIAIYFALVASIMAVFYLGNTFTENIGHKLAGLIIGSTIIVLIGLWDDVKNIRPIIKLIGQITAASILFFYGFRIEILSNPLGGGTIHVPLFLDAVITVAWFVGLINAMNLIDGLDGLAAGITVIVCETLIFVSIFRNDFTTAFILATLGGSALGFLRYNFYPAKIFMGDTGSMLIGLVLAAAGIVSTQKSATAVALLIPLTALTIPLYDTLLAIIRRAKEKQPIFEADKRHIHHRLLEMGLTQKEIVLTLYFITAYLGIFAFLFVLIPEEYALLLLILLAIGLLMLTRVIWFIEKKVKLIRRLQREE